MWSSATEPERLSCEVQVLPSTSGALRRDRFFSSVASMPHAKVQRFAVVDYKKEMAIVGVVEEGEQEKIIAVGRYLLDPSTRLGEVAFVVHNDRNITNLL